MFPFWKYRKLFNLRARKFHFLKYEKLFRDGFFFFLSLGFEVRQGPYSCHMSQEAQRRCHNVVTTPDDSLCGRC